ncbi:hypothetical protein O181_017809 [Austropuccinia psidii MF-1]|uniref:Tf2-1-like SH3-like domain-containing protein n=1 Tax=Austropuccinia psidii MF-1 TaxID=1389203 RepID=A0A9Q3C430_9BASI|nr:hypothetical protein [Austropuccinia psidii MF-1]
MIQIIEEMIRRFSAYSLEFKDSDGFKNEWWTLIPELELEYKKPVHSSTAKKKLKDSYLGPFVIVALHGTNAFQVKLNGELENKNPMFPVILLQAYQPADKELYPLSNPAPLAVPPVENNGDKKDNEIH